jgi:hypothetical protein
MKSVVVDSSEHGLSHLSTRNRVRLALTLFFSSAPPTSITPLTPDLQRPSIPPEQHTQTHTDCRPLCIHHRSHPDYAIQLEESVSILTSQLEDARRQLSAAAYANSSRLGYSPDSKDVAQLSAENAYLRDENTDLRRQLYALRVSSGSEPPSAGGVSGAIIEMPKQEPGAGPMYGVYGGPQQVMVSPPRVASSSHARTMSHPGDFTRVSTPTRTTVTGSSAVCAPGGDHALLLIPVSLALCAKIIAADMAGPSRRRDCEHIQRVLPASAVPAQHCCG